MNIKALRFLATSLFLALVLVCVLFVSASSQAHAAQLKPAVEKSNVFPMSEKQIDSARSAMNNCKPAGYVYPYNWKIRLHLTSCGVQLVVSGTSLAALFPDTTIPAGIATAAISGASALSCDGSVNIDYSVVNLILPMPSVSPGC